MKRLIYCTVLFMLSAQTLWAQAIFQRSYGGEGSEFGRAVIECSTGGFLLVGSTNSYFDPSTDMYVLRVDEEGEYIWGRSIGMPNRIDWARDVKETADGNFIIAGYTNATSNGDYDGTLIKIDTEGSIVWSRTYGDEDWDFIENMAVSETGEIYLAGQTTLEGQLVGWLIKTTEAGDVIWEKEFEGNGMAQLTGVDICETGKIVFTGYNYSVLLNQNTQLSGAVYENGETNWVAGYPEFGNVTTQNCICDNNNQIASSGTFHFDSTQTLFYSAINSDNGSIVWTETEGSEVFRIGSGINQLENGQYLFGLSMFGLGYGELDGFVEIRNTNGSWISVDFSQVFGGTQTDYFHGVIPTSDGGYAAVGETNSFGNNYQMYLIKANADNEIDFINVDFLDLATNTEEKQPSWSQPWPNPATDVLYLNPLKPSISAVYRIYDNKGIELESGVLKQKIGNATINVANLSVGVYYIQIIEGNGNSFSHKFLKVH